MSIQVIYTLEWYVGHHCFPLCGGAEAQSSGLNWYRIQKPASVLISISCWFWKGIANLYISMVKSFSDSFFMEIAWASLTVLGCFCFLSELRSQISRFWAREIIHGLIAFVVLQTPWFCSYHVYDKTAYICL